MAAKKTVDKVAKTAAPSGLAITREGTRFVFTWKITDEDYDKGQQVQYKINNGDWVSISGVNKKDTAKSLTVTASHYFPHTTLKLESVSFRVRGKRTPTTKESTKQITRYTYDWSGWKEKKYAVKIPKAPTIEATLSTSSYNVTTFSWEVADSGSTDQTWFTDVVYQTILVKDCNSNGDKQTWSRNSTGWGTGDGQSASGSISRTEQLATNSRTRFVRVKARGPAGETGWRYASHVYAQPKPAEITSISVKPATGGYQCTLKWKAPNTKANPVDKTVVQYANVVPTSGLTPSAGSSWTDIVTANDTIDTTSATFMLDTSVTLDHAIFFRVMSEHDPYDTSRAYSEPVTHKNVVGRLTPPSDLSVTHVSGKTYSVSASDESEVPDSYVVIALIKNGSSNLVRKGTIPNGSSDPITFKTQMSAQEGFSVVAFAEAKSGDIKLTSTKVRWESGDLPTAPTGVTLSNEGNGVVLVSWTNTWELTEGADITWSRDQDAWESTEEPESYSIKEEATRWYVHGLEVGTWYFRVRSTGGDNEIGPWSETASINLAQKPETPVLSLSAGRIGRNGNVTLSWTYSNPDGSPQAFAKLAQVTMSGDTVSSYGPVIATVETAQSATIYAEALKWTAGEKYICVQTYSESGEMSKWSAPVMVEVVARPTATISQISLTSETITEDGASRTASVLKVMPFTITVTGADAGATTTVIIERAESYHMEHPSGRALDGFEGETVALMRQTGDAQITIMNRDLIGRLDDGAKYRVIAEVCDEFGQTATVSRKFEVHWTYQAYVPSATVVVDGLITKITPIRPSGAGTNATCDIYRLSADMPELIVKGAAWGTTYVDPYPALGEYGGHRIVLKTVNGDYITADNQPAWKDYGADEDDIVELEYPATIIDFDGSRAILNWNMSASSRWSKDFSETKYLGGSVQGDWNAAISRSGSVSAVVVQAEDPELIRTMRALAAYPGVCHVRTPDGSSYAADVQVSETSGAKLVRFDLTITRVDPEGFDGMTLAQWIEEASED